MSGKNRTVIMFLFIILNVLQNRMLLSTEADLAGKFESRRKQLLSYYASTTIRPSFQGACAKLATGIDVKTGLDFIHNKLLHPTGDMFYIYPLIGTYLYFHNQLPEDIQNRMREMFRIYTPYRGDTENHWLMYYTAMLLAAQTWPNQDCTKWFNGKSSEENYSEALEYLEYWIQMTTQKGQGEFDSPDYAGVYLSPLALLYDFAEDPDLKLKSRMMMDYFLADWAGEHLKGMLCGGNSRVYEPQVYTPKRPVISTILWLYFGECEFNPKASMHEAIFPALCSYRCPGIVINIASDRSKPYVHTETKRVRNVIRYGQERNPPVYKTNYMTRNYCLGSLHGGILQPIQQHTWNVTWVSDEPHSKIFTLHPYFSERELATFFPEEPKVMVAEVVKSKGTYNKPDKWTGGSPFEQTFQNENAIIVLYNIKKGEGWPYIDGFFPKQLDEREKDPSGWIFCREGEVYIAFYPLKPYKWIEEDVCFRFRSNHLKNGVVLEVSSSDDFISFDSFKKAIKYNFLDTSRFEQELIVIYTTLHGNVMEFEYDGLRILNGKKVDFKDYGLFNSPYMHAEPGEGKLEIRYGPTVRILDFKNGTLCEKVKK
jgi:hypothetical protein